MGTKSHIAIERENGAVESIRCQYDGYPAYNGALLLQHYKYSGWLSAGINIIIAKFFPTEPGEHATIN